ncbi:Arc/MetJ family transcription regulator [Kitasatospora sp. MAP12-15]|uniref:type II toxin-antitoxin system VapB family antitoxin n=1 Tax=unclassified Kitasatospora TaxID=2633591 RepID=UPI0024767ABB|nr:type II toxin-antitoxin system VapB family antitoxin [Kitasatospora sp. MAP12-44]MDH6111043.1 Arc/MetJ family transcription regulator [Kitasatospora sp. MAP12-44]
MSMTNIDIDDEILSEAMRILGMRTKKETVNAALLEVVRRVKRVRAAERLAERARRGEFDAAIKAHEDSRRAEREAFGP